ncbi:DUF1837 domain-containing protein [Roseomonas aeriglobus]|nr:DUF1837 domain-containing protein [Roseomonas aeriglobus]
MSVPAISPSVLQTALEALCSDHSGFDDHFRRLPFAWPADGSLVNGDFLHPLFGADGADMDALVEHIYRSLIPFCLPRGEVKKVTKAALAAGDIHPIIALADRARELFVRTRGATTAGGEAGELILFLLLEALIKAPLLVSKMSLKTNSNMNVHGRDGIHLRYCPSLNGLVLHLGESKLHKGLAAAVDDAVSSIEQYLGDRALRRREVDIINGNMDLSGLDAESEQHLRAVLNPYASPPSPVHRTHTCFIGFEYGGYAKVAGIDSTKVEAEFQRVYARRAQTAAPLILEKSAKLPATTRLHFFVMPFPDVDSFRTTFSQKLGVQID